MYHKEGMHNSYHLVGFGRETNSNGQKTYVISVRDVDLRHTLVAKQMESLTDLAHYGGKIIQPDLTYQIYEKHFVGHQEYRNKDGDKPSNSERTLQITKEK